MAPAVRLRVSRSLMSPFVARQGGGLAQNLLLTSALPKSSTRLWLRSAGCALQPPARAPASPPKFLGGTAGAAHFRAQAGRPSWSFSRLLGRGPHAERGGVREQSPDRQTRQVA